VPRQRFLRFHAALSALLTQPFLLSLTLALNFLALILTLDSCILILLCLPHHTKALASEHEQSRSPGVRPWT
jgi:hypothetical protein